MQTKLDELNKSPPKENESKISIIKKSLDLSVNKLQSNLDTIENKIDQVQQLSATKIDEATTIKLANIDQSANDLQIRLKNIEDKLDQIQVHSTAALDEKIKLRIAFKQSQEQEEYKSELTKMSDNINKLMSKQSTPPGTDYDQSVAYLKAEMTKLSEKFDSLSKVVETKNH